MSNYRISTNKKDLDTDLVHNFLSQSYWAAGIPKETLLNAIDNSFCFGVFTETNEQVGFARLITDKATFAYLADVFILEEHRNRGLAKRLVKEILSHPELQGMRRINLATRDAHELYKPFGFTALSNPQNMMEIINPNVYKKI
tara:strand:+ start:134 stop:562 length:429 start_codon:yes stop_codon:yes gene_type:complete